MDQVVKLLAELYALWTGEGAAEALLVPPPARPDLEALIVRQQTEIALLNSAVAELEAEAATRDRQVQHRPTAPAQARRRLILERHDALAQQVARLQAFADHQTTLLRDQTRQLAAQHRHLRARDTLIRTLLRLLLQPPPLPEDPAAAPHGAGPSTDAGLRLATHAHSGYRTSVVRTTSEGSSPRSRKLCADRVLYDDLTRITCHSLDRLLMRLLTHNFSSAILCAVRFSPSIIHPYLSSWPQASKHSHLSLQQRAHRRGARCRRAPGVLLRNAHDATLSLI